MRTVVAHRAGGPEVLEPTEVPDPLPGPGQVRIAVEYASVTFIDTRLRAAAGPVPPPDFPVVLGNGIGGRIDAVGDGVDPALGGAVVVAATGGSGGYASAAVVDAAAVHRVPDGLALAEATTVLADGRTALALARHADPSAEDVVVITAASGGVGTLLTQLAAGTGAFVIALAGSEEKLRHARDNGAGIAIDYRGPDWADRLADAAAGVPAGGAAEAGVRARSAAGTSGQGEAGVTIAFDGVGGATSTALRASLRPGGHHLVFGAAGGDLPGAPPEGSDIRVSTLADVIAGPEDNASLVDSALDLAARGLIRPLIGQTFPLAEAAAAHAAIETRRTIGKTLLIP